MRHFVIIVLFIFVLTNKSLACDCYPGAPFLTIAPKAKLVSLVKVLKYLTFSEIYGVKTPMSMQVEIIEIYNGVERRRKVRVWGDAGNLCRPYLSVFKEGEYYLIAFYAGSSNHGQEKEKVTDYSISNCGTFWLGIDIKKLVALGNIDIYGHQSMKLAQLKKSQFRSIEEH